MMQSSPNEFSDNEQEGPPTTPWELRDIIAREIEVLGPHCDLNHIDVPQMTSLADVFFRSDFNGDISLWDTSRVASLENTFAGSRFNGDLSRWDTSNVTNMAGAFQNTVFTGDLSTWDTRNVHHSLVKGAATNTLHWWSGELTANYLAMQVVLGFNTERDAGVAFFIVF